MDEALRAKLPESGLKAVLHIHSRVRHFRGVHSIIHDMIVGSCMSGLAWDSEMKIVVAEKEVWRTYLKVCPVFSIYAIPFLHSLKCLQIRFFLD